MAIKIFSPLKRGKNLNRKISYQPISCDLCWTGLLTEEVTTIGKGFYNIPGRNLWWSVSYIYVTLTGCYFHRVGVNL